MKRDKKIIIIAGPNGAGKTTFAREFLPNEADCPVFVNADLIAEGLSPFAPEVVELRAGRIMLEEIKAHARAGTSFAFETTMSGRAYLASLTRWKKAGYRIEIGPAPALLALAVTWRRKAVRMAGAAVCALLLIASAAVFNSTTTVSSTTKSIR